MSDFERAFEPGPRLHPTFFGRDRELKWLLDRFRRSREPVFITGVGGVGKTTLLRQFLGSVRTERLPAVWSPRGLPEEAMSEISARIGELRRDLIPPEIVAVDGAEGLGERELDEIAGRIANLKQVRMLIFTSRLPPRGSRAKELRLEPLMVEDAVEMLRRLVGDDLPGVELARVVETAGGLPLALRLIADQLRGAPREDLDRVLRGEIYQLSRQILIPERALVAEVKPRLMLVNEALMERLRLQPRAMHDLPPRKFEELVAELLSDLGYEVELTPATRDGGKDILAYMSTPLGRLLCLVEAKRHRRDRPVGVGLVRQLFGTLSDAEANSAMLVTTSTFSPDARQFQRRHEYRLSLRDYGSLVGWIEGYGKH